MIRTVVSQHIDAPAEQVRALYVDPSNWPSIFPRTIRGTRVVREFETAKVIEVDHVEGKVFNVLRPRSAERVDLEEKKRHYDATFVNTFQAANGGTLYVLAAQVRLRGLLRLLEPFAKPLVRARMQRFVLEPLKAAAEGRTQSALTDGSRRSRS